MALTKALIVNQDTGLLIPVMFNPPQYQLQTTNQFADVAVPGLGSSLLQFVRGNAQNLTMELFFDSSDTGADVRGATEAIIGLTKLNPKSHAPPKLLFIWGSLIFPCVLESVSQDYLRFNRQGMPLRARLNVTLKGYDALEELLASVPLESSDKTKQHVVKEGETLQGIAAQEYDDPRQWRPIAEANDIINPLTISPGMELILPSLSRA